MAPRSKRATSIEVVPTPDQPITSQAKTDIQWYEDKIPIRGCQFDLAQIKSAYRELEQLTRKEGDRIIGQFVRPNEKTDAQFRRENEALKNRAFRVTVSIIGFDGQTVYGDSEDIFDNKNLPFPVERIFFTNENAFKNNADGTLPENRFSIWISFDKPPLLDPNPLVSHPTPNYSEVAINARDVTYIRAVQHIVRNKLMKGKKWYSFIHEKFFYDIGLWFLALPYALYMVTVATDKLLPEGGAYSSFRLPFFIYAMGMSLLIYRALAGYVKWAFPVNILKENEDTATVHRVIFWSIIVGFIGAGVRTGLGFMWPW